MILIESSKTLRFWLFVLFVLFIPFMIVAGIGRLLALIAYPFLTPYMLWKYGRIVSHNEYFSYYF